MISKFLSNRIFEKNFGFTFNLSLKPFEITNVEEKEKALKIFNIFRI